MKSIFHNKHTALTVFATLHTGMAIFFIACWNKGCRKTQHFPAALILYRTFSISSITIRSALILAYFLSLDSSTCHGAYVVLVFFIISLTAVSYKSHLSRFRQSSSVIFHCFSGVFWRSVNRASWTSLSICTQNLIITAPQSDS